MNLKISLIIMLAILISTFSYAQEQKAKEAPKVNVGLEGMLGFSKGKDFYAFNLGGPTLMLKLTKDWKLGICALPSFFVMNGKTAAKLGFSPRLDFKNYSLIAPFYQIDNTGTWYGSLGLSYKFVQKK